MARARFAQGASRWHGAYLDEIAPDGSKQVYLTGTRPGQSVTMRYPAFYHFNPAGDAAELLDRSRTIVGDVLEIDGVTDYFSPDKQVFSAATLSADGSSVYYLADAERDNQFNLYRVPFAGGEAIKLAEGVNYFRLSPDETRIVYYSATASAYFSIPSTGGNTIQLAQVTTFDAEDDLSQFFFSADSQQIILRVDDVLRSSALDGSGVIVLADKVADFVFVPTVNRVVYTVDVDITFDTVKVYSRNIDGATPAVLLNPTGTSVTYFAVTDDDETLVTVTNKQGTFGLDRPYKIQAVPVGGGVVTDLTTIADEQYFDAMQFSPDSERVLLTTKDGFDPFAATKRVFSLPIDGSAGVTLFEGQPGQQITTQISADSARLLTMIKDSNYSYTLTNVLLTGGTTTTVATLPDGTYETPGFAITPDSSSVVFRTPDGWPARRGPAR
ncbi:hypothetical protein HC891_21905 [Candidatus Gracilibacteria bacterium]|nr:hypothetical protein [Candidatus Gracilibacteria bacterium]